MVNILRVSHNISILLENHAFISFEVTASSIFHSLGFGSIVSILLITSQEDGIEIEKSFKNLLEKAGVEEIKTDIEFNPELHEAIMQINSDSHAEGEIVQTLQKGYKIKDRILRPAKVSLAK